MKKTVITSLLFIFLFTVNSFSDAVIEMEYKDNVSQTVNKSTRNAKITHLLTAFIHFIFSAGVAAYIARACLL